MKLLFFALCLFLFLGLSFAWFDVGGGNCTCNTCGDCYNALNNNVNCSVKVTLTTNIGSSGNCIYDPPNFDTKILDCDGFRITGDGGTSDMGIYLFQNNNVEIRNCDFRTWGFATYFNDVDDSDIINNSFQGGTTAIYFFEAEDNNVINNTIFSMGNWGVDLHTSSFRNTFIGNNISNTERAFQIYSADDALYKDNILYENDAGFRLYNANNHTIINTTSTNNTAHGLYCDRTCYQINITNSTFADNPVYDIFLTANGDANCDNSLTNVTGTGNLPILYSKTQVSWSNLKLSSLILCNADDSRINNITTAGTGIIVMRTDNAQINNSNISNTFPGFYVGYGGDNLFFNNTVSNVSAFGFYVYSTDDNNFTKNTVSYSGGGFLTSRLTTSTPNSYRNIFFNNTVYNSSLHPGYYVSYAGGGFHFDSYSFNNDVIGNLAYNNTGSGFVAFSNGNLAYNTLEDNIAHHNRDGFSISTRGSTATNNRAYNNTGYGFSITGAYLSADSYTSNRAYNNTIGFYLSGRNKVLTNNIAQDNLHLDLGLYAYSDLLCDNQITGMIGSGGRPINYSNTQVNWNNLDVSEIVLCNADNSVLDGITVRGSDIRNNNGILVTRTDNSEIKNSNSSGNYVGLQVFDDALNSNFTNNTFHNNRIGLHIFKDPIGNRFWNTSFSNNNYDFYVNASANIYYYMYNSTFLNPLGTQPNQTVLSIVDSVASNAVYSINWTTNSTNLPNQRVTFLGKYVEIINHSNNTIPIQINSTTWHWNESEGVADALFELWKYNVSDGWTMLNNTPDTNANTLSLFQWSPASIYGILTTVSTCQVISSPGDYQLNINLEGAPISVSGVSSISEACIVIASNDVLFSCSGFNVTNNGTINATGILVNGSATINYTNVTIQDCPRVAGYEVDVYIYQSAFDKVRNVSAYDSESIDTAAGIKLHDAEHSVVTNSRAFNNSYAGISSVGGEHNNITNNTAYNNTQGFLLESAQKHLLTFNRAYNNTDTGFYLDQSGNITARYNVAYFNNRSFYLWHSEANLLDNNTAHNNSYGFIIDRESHNTNLTSNTAHDNTFNGFDSTILGDTLTNTLFRNNTAYDNGQYGFSSTGFTTYTTFVNNTAHDNGLLGFIVATNYHTVENNTAYGNGMAGFYFSAFRHSRVYNNTAHRNPGGIVFHLSDNVTVLSNLAHNNTLAGIGINQSVDIEVINSTMYNNKYDFYVDGASGYNMTTCYFLPDSGTFVNFTNLSIEDVSGPAEEYSIDWTINSSALPGPPSFAEHFSFRQKWADISTQAGTVSIDEVVWHWRQDEVTAPPYNEMNFELWKWNASGWTLLNNSPNTGTHTLSQYAMNPASTYGILQINVTNCPVVSSPGPFQMFGDYNGSPNAVSGVSDISSACVVIASDDVIFDCSGYDITHTGVANTAAIVVNGTSSYQYDNITIRNCPNLAGYEFGAYLYYASNSRIANITAVGNIFGIGVGRSHHNNITDNNLINNTGDGLATFSSSSHNEYHNNEVLDSSQRGFYLADGTNNTFVNNTVSYNNMEGFYLTNNFYGNTFIGNTIYKNTNEAFDIRTGCGNNVYTGNNLTENVAGFLVNAANDNTFLHNYAYDVNNAFTLVSSSRNNFTDNSVYNGAMAFYIYFSSNDNTLADNRMEGNDYGIYQYFNSVRNNFTDNILIGNERAVYLRSNSNNNRFVGNSLHNNTIYGFQIDDSHYDTFTGNNITNSVYGFHILGDYNNFTGNSISLNNQYGYLVDSGSDNNTLINDTVFMNQRGISVFRAPNTVISNAHLYNNTLYDIDFSAAAPYSVYLNNVTIDNPYGNYTNFTVLYIADAMEAFSGYSIQWYSSTQSPPSSAVSFASTYADISMVSGAPSIDWISWNWYDSELPGYDENTFNLLKYDAGWELVPNQLLEPAQNRITVTALNSTGTVLGIFSYTVNASILKLNQTALQPSPGGIVEFNITVNNTGNVTINASVVDQLPIGLTHLNSIPAPDNIDGQNLTWNNVGPLAPGVSTVIYVNATVNAGVVSQATPIVNLTNYVNVTGTPVPDIGPPVFEESYANATIYYANVSVLKLNQTVATPSPGGLVQFNITINNTGNVTLSTVRINDSLPSILRYATAVPAPNLNIGDQNLTWNNVGPILPGASTVIYLNATVRNNPILYGCDLLATNQVEAEGVPLNGDNVSALDSVQVYIACANVSVIKLDQTVFQPSPGGTVEFEINVTNEGNVTLSSLVVNDQLPVGLDYSNDDRGGTVIGQLINWTFFSLNPGDSEIIYINATANDSIVGCDLTVINLVDTEGVPLNGDNVTALNFAPIYLACANVSVLKLDQSIQQLSPGGLVEFNITVTNDGNVSLNPLEIIDELPAGLTHLNSIPAPDAISGQNLTWNTLGPLAPGASTIIYINATVDPGVANSTNKIVILQNYVNTTGVPPNGFNVTAEDTADVTVYYANISIVKLDQSIQQLSPGGSVEFNLTITNIGNVTLNPVEVIDDLPAGLTYQSAIPLPDDASGPIVWDDVGPLSPGASTEIMLYATVDPGVVGVGFEIVNLTNYVNATGVPPNGDDVISESEANATIYYANVSILKLDLTAAPPTPGGIVEFQIDVTNTGNVTLNPVEVVDTLPAGFSFSTTNTSGYIVAGQTITWANVGPIPPGSIISILLNATVDSGTANGTYVNTAGAQGTPPNGDDVADSDAVSFGVNSSAINVVKTSSAYQVEVGDNVTFNLTITNTGQVNLTIWVQDTLPTQLTYLPGEADPPPTSILGQTLYWDAIAVELDSGGSFIITYNMSVDSGGSMTNDVLVTGIPPNGDNVTDIDSVTLTTPSPPPTTDGGKDKLTLDAVAPEYTWDEVKFIVREGGRIENAKIYIKLGTGEFSRVATTDDNGEAFYTPLEAGTYYAYASKGGYTDSSRLSFTIFLRTFEVSAPGSAEEGEEFTISIRYNGEPVEGAEISIDGEDRTTDEDGEARFSLGPGEYLLSVEKEGYHRLTRSLTVNAAEEEPEPEKEPPLEPPYVPPVIEPEPPPEEPLPLPTFEIEIPLSEELQQPVTEEQLQIQQENCLAFFLLLLLLVILYWVYRKRKKKEEQQY